MRKGLVGGLTIVVLGVIVGMPFVMGRIAEPQIKNVISHLPNNQIKITLQSYDRGWFTSQAKFAIQVETPFAQQLLNNQSNPTDSSTSNKSSSFNFIATANIQHGPILLTRDEKNQRSVKFGFAAMQSSIALSNKDKTLIQQSYEGSLPNFFASSFLTFNKKFINMVAIPAFSLTNKQDKSVVSSAGLNGEWQITAANNNITGNLALQNLGFGINTKKFQIENVNFKYEQTKQSESNSGGLWVGNVSINLPSVSVKEDGKFDVAVKGVALDTQSHVNKGLFDSSAKANFEKVIINDVAYGPGHYEVTATRLNAVALAKLKEQIDRARSMPIQERQTLFLSLLPLWGELLSQGAEFEVQNLEFLTPDGTLSVKGKVSLQQQSQTASTNGATDATSAQGQQIALNALPSLSNIIVNLDMNLPIALTQKGITHFYTKMYNQQQASQQALLAAQQQQSPTDAVTSMTASTKSEQEIIALAEQTTKQQLTQWVNTGMLIEKNGIYQLNISYKEGQLLINGKNPKVTANPVASSELINSATPAISTAPTASNPNAVNPQLPAGVASVTATTTDAQKQTVAPTTTTTASVTNTTNSAIPATTVSKAISRVSSSNTTSASATTTNPNAPTTTTSNSASTPASSTTATVTN